MIELWAFDNIIMFCPLFWAMFDKFSYDVNQFSKLFKYECSKALVWKSKNLLWYFVSIENLLVWAILLLTLFLGMLL